MVSSFSSALGLGLSRQQRPFRVGESNALSAQPFFEQPILSLEGFDDDLLVAIDPASKDHQQERERGWH